ncbi:MAG: hypothetical protein CGW95_08590, partial [Phenylobacterium zucineum]
MVAGDFNASWDGVHGPIRGLGRWAVGSSLLSPIASLSSPDDPIHSFYRGNTPTSLIDHILLSQACLGHIVRAGVYTGSFFSSISDHRPVVLALSLWTHTPALTTEGLLPRPPTRAPDLDGQNPALVAAYQAQLLTHLPTLEAGDPHHAGAALLTLSTLSASITRDLLRPPRRASLSHGRSRFDGWSPVAISLKANLTALVNIDGHLRGHRSYRRWTTQDLMDADIAGITTNWVETVRSFTWDDPSVPHQLMDITGYGPSFWRTTPLRAIQHPRFCQDLIRQVRKCLHGRHRCTLRSFLSLKSAEIEQSRLKGKIGAALRSV